MNAEPIKYQSGIKDVVFGPNVRLVEPLNIYGCEIGEDSFIGPFVEIQRGAKVGRRCRVQSHTFICERVTIEDDCFIGHGVMFINDLFKNGVPNYTDPTAWLPTLIGRGCSIGSNATILPVKIAPGSVIGAGAVVTSDIPHPGVYAGNPARLIRSLPDQTASS